MEGVAVSTTPGLGLEIVAQSGVGSDSISSISDARTGVEGGFWLPRGVGCHSKESVESAGMVDAILWLLFAVFSSIVVSFLCNVGREVHSRDTSGCEYVAPLVF